MDSVIITLDGPAGSGKSTIARHLAKRLSLEFLDTGAMYRGFTARCIDEGIHIQYDHEGAIEIASTEKIRYDWTTDPPRLIVGGVDVTDRIRDFDVTRHVSDMASIPRIREILVSVQRQIGAEHPRLVTEGRDQGSVVFPNANVKFFLDARPEVRAKRRAEQLRAAGKQADERQILDEINNRDEKDSTRKEGPLICPADAITIDTSDMSLEHVVTVLEEMCRKKLGAILDQKPPTNPPLKSGSGVGILAAGSGILAAGSGLLTNLGRGMTGKKTPQPPQTQQPEKKDSSDAGGH